MKTTKSMTLAIAAMCALGASALADQQPNQKAKMPSRQAEKAQASNKTWDSQPMPLRAVGFPVVFLERTGHSLIRSPKIVSETFKGERNLVSKRGLMTEREMKQTKLNKSTSASSKSAANRRE